MFSDRGNRRRANHFHISFVNDILPLNAFGLVVFENEDDDDDDDVLYIFSLCFHMHRKYRSVSYLYSLNTIITVQIH